jgi:hypothetical protein
LHTVTSEADSPAGADCYRFFDLDLSLTCDSPHFAGVFRQMYGRFLIEAPAQARCFRAVAYAGSDNAWGRPCVEMDRERHLMRDGWLVEAFLHDTILDAIVSRVRSHVLIHAGAVTRAGRAIVLCGDPMHGKSTTVLALIQRGFGFLSDEIAAIGRADGRVYPFPRSLRLRLDTLSRLGCERTADSAEVWCQKHLLDVERISPNCLVSSAEIGDIVILTAPNEEIELTSNGRAGPAEVFVDRMDGEIVAAAQGMPGVSEVETAEYRGACGLRFVSLNREAALTAVEDLCRSLGVRVVGTTTRPLQTADFSRPPRMERIPPTQAAMELVRRLEGGPASAVLCEVHGGRSTRLFIELNRLIARARCWRLLVGPLNGVTDLLCGLVDT